MDELITIKNWKDYVVEGEDLEDLKNVLKEQGWLDDEGNLVLYKKYSDGTDMFWEFFDVAFDEKILEQIEN